MRLFLAALLLATPATAQAPDGAPWQQSFDECVHGMDSAPDMAACKGQVARLCMDETEGGHTTFGMTGCQAMEKNLWDDLLNADWRGHRQMATEDDASEREFFGDQYSDRLENLIKAQRAWIAFRDAECALVWANWGSGSMRYTAASACELDMTADRVITLRQMTEGDR